MASADSKEVEHLFLSDGSTVASASESCKLRRVGSGIAMAAGFIRANQFNALDYIREMYQPGEELHQFARRLLKTLPERLGPALEAARRVGDGDLRKALAEQNALEVALIGTEDGQPAVEVLVFKADADKAGHLSFKAFEQRCPGDCPGGTAAYFLGTHEAIDRAIAANPGLAADATREGVTRLTRLEYASRPDIIGGPLTLVRGDSKGVVVTEPGACRADDIGEPAQISSRKGDAAMEPLLLQPFLEELDRRIMGVTNLLCHQTIQRNSRNGRQVREDVVDADLRIVGRTEMYSDIRSNGRYYKRFADLPGAWASGDLVTMLLVTRNALSLGAVRLASRTGEDGVPEVGAAFTRGERSGSWNMFVDAVPHPMAFEGTAWFEQSDGRLRQIEWRSTGEVQPSRMNITQVSWQVNFSTVEVAGEAFLAPAAAAYAIRYRPHVRREDRTLSTFSGFQRFAGMARMLD
ncbi:MAG TPA: hypothetical protein VNH18_27890 [Bryobacteraceae bacterium]|nr:hypothetical protein [Bryobacteraceae bacterium]